MVVSGHRSYARSVKPGLALGVNVLTNIVQRWNCWRSTQTGSSQRSPCCSYYARPQQRGCHCLLPHNYCHCPSKYYPAPHHILCLMSGRTGPNTKGSPQLGWKLQRTVAGTGATVARPCLRPARSGKRSAVAPSFAGDRGSYICSCSTPCLRSSRHVECLRKLLQPCALFSRTSRAARPQQTASERVERGFRVVAMVR